MNPKSQYIMVLANSARMLVEAAYQAGFKPLAIDLFCDQDTRSYAADFLQVSTMAEEDLFPAIDYFVSRYPVANAVCGSGFEQNSDCLKCISDRLTLIGNQPDVFAKLHNKPAFFALLQTLKIPFPTVAFSSPDKSEGWLVKPVYGQGGVGIRKYCEYSSYGYPVYWQKYQAGEPHSVLFVADGKRSQIIGFNRQWSISLNDKDPFIFSGIINDTRLTIRQKAKIGCWLDKLVVALSLKGLNSLDFIQSGQISYVLEINPRPPASMQLYNADLLIRHIKACAGELLKYDPVQAEFTGYQVVYAPRNMQIPEGFQWPEGIVDLPNANTIISTGQPICSIITHADAPESVLAKLQLRQELIINQLNRFQTHGI